MDPSPDVGSRLVRSGGYLINLQTRALLLPVHLCKVWFAGSLNVLLALFHLLGLMPNEFSNRVKIAELNRHIDSMHQREEEYRRRVQALAEQLELQSKDKSRAVKKLNRARADAQELSQSVETLQRSASRRSFSGEGGAGVDGGARLCHGLLWGAVAAVYAASGSLTRLELKLLLSVTVPVVLMYFMMQTSGGVPPGWKTVAIQCVSAGVLGFTLNHLVC